MRPAWRPPDHATVTIMVRPSETAVEEASASVSVRHFGQSQFTMNPERARQVSVSTFFEAINSDLYPPENMEKIFGVCETTSVGKVVYNAWLTLKLRGKVSEANVTSAIAGGRLPQFFEEAIRSLGPDEQSYYSGWLTGDVDVDPMSAMRFPGLPSGALFENIEWNERALCAMADDDRSPDRAGVAARPREPDAAAARELFAEGVAQGVPVGGGVPVVQGMPTDVAAAVPVAVAEASPLTPQEEQMVRQNLRSMVGRDFIVRHLSSARGAELNGKRARVVGVDREPGRYRAHCQIEGVAEPMRLKLNNISDVRDDRYDGYQALPERARRRRTEAVVGSIRDLLANEYTPQWQRSMGQRTDMIRRVEYLRLHAEAGRAPPPLLCGASVTQGEHSSWSQAINHMKPCCYGDNTADLRAMPVGDEDAIKEWVMSGYCGRCQEVVFGGEEIAASVRGNSGLALPVGPNGQVVAMEE